MKAIPIASFLLATLPLAAQDPPVFPTDTSLALVRFQVFEYGPSTNRTTPVDPALLFDINAGLLNPLVFKTTILDGLPNGSTRTLLH